MSVGSPYGDFRHILSVEALDSNWMDWLRNRLNRDAIFLIGDLLVSIVCCLALALLLNQTGNPYVGDLLVLLTVPVYYAAFHFRRSTYLQAFFIAVACALAGWPIDWLVPIDLFPVAAGVSVCAITGEVIHRASRQSRKLHQALLESEDLYRNVIRAAAAVPYFLDFRTQEYNMLGGEIENLTGYSAEETTRLLMRSLTKEVHPQGALSGMSDEEAARCIQTQPGVRWHAEYRIETRSGEERWLTDSAVQVKDTDGKSIIGTFGILQDITARKLAELDLREREQDEKTNSEELKLLHEAGNALSTEPTLDGLCRKAVELGREILDLDRLGLWILDPVDATNAAIGSGTRTCHLPQNSCGTNRVTGYIVMRFFSITGTKLWGTGISSMPAFGMPTELSGISPPITPFGNSLSPSGNASCWPCMRSPSGTCTL